MVRGRYGLVFNYSTSAPMQGHSQPTRHAALAVGHSDVIATIFPATGVLKDNRHNKLKE